MHTLIGGFSGKRWDTISSFFSRLHAELLQKLNNSSFAVNTMLQIPSWYCGHHIHGEGRTKPNIHQQEHHPYMAYKLPDTVPFPSFPFPVTTVRTNANKSHTYASLLYGSLTGIFL